MELHNLKPATGSTKNRKRIGRGEGSKKGGTSTRGHKGAKSRSGYSKKIGFEGGQQPLQRRVPKFGFTNPNRVEYNCVNIDTLQKLVDNKKIKCTVYQKEDKVMITIASWSKKDEFLRLNIDWDKLGFDKSKSTLISPMISGLQSRNELKVDQEIRVEKDRGIVLILSKK